MSMVDGTIIVGIALNKMVHSLDFTDIMVK
jgi:hypothetical protein